MGEGIRKIEVGHLSDNSVTTVRYLNHGRLWLCQFVYIKQSEC